MVLLWVAYLLGANQRCIYSTRLGYIIYGLTIRLRAGYVALLCCLELAMLHCIELAALHCLELATLHCLELAALNWY